MAVMKWVSLACLSALFMNGAYAENAASTAVPGPNISSIPGPIYNASNPNYLPYFVAPVDQNLMVAQPLVKGQKTKLYILPATPATTNWGVFDSSKKPALVINSGDSVMIETISCMENQLLPGVPIETVEKLTAEDTNRGPHTLTGPIYINGAVPGDVLAIHINRLVLKPQASNNTLPGKGLFPEKFPKAQVKYFYLDVYHHQMDFGPGIRVPLRPFPGVVAVERAQAGIYDSIPPGDFGGNMDLREMVEGTTLYLPVFVKGGMLWTGDSHAGQGNGEIDLTAIESAFSEMNVTITVLKNKSLDRPLVETPTDWITVGYDTDLNKALASAQAESINFIMGEQKVSRDQATQFYYRTWNCPISEVVNGVKGVYCMIPKDANAPTPAPLPVVSNNKEFVTVGSDSDALQAMKKASWAMMQDLVKQRNMALNDAYVLASIAMDCRFAPYISGDKEVHCMMPKSLWVNTAQY
ncbi:MAG: acetamidase/formamidase family protein [Gammaproteobacteria bacterium]|nr:acetamidase/formamidase family protein [Gammaproteobacteria bacterium]